MERSLTIDREKFSNIMCNRKFRIVSEKLLNFDTVEKIRIVISL